MGLTRFALRFAAPLPRIESFERYLFIGPHPDDIEIGAGATAAKLVSLGKQVTFLICTDGRFGLGSAPAGTTPDQLAEMRRAESLRSAAILGVQDVRFLNLQDGAGYDVHDLLLGIAGTVARLQPDVIFAPDPCVSSECHQDHLNVGMVARQIACFAPYGEIMQQYQAAKAPVKALCYYMTARPNRMVNTGGFLEKQFSSIFDCHLSQYPKGSQEAASIRTYLKLRSVDFALRSFNLRFSSEGFRMLDQLHMHCLPEAGL